MSKTITDNASIPLEAVLFDKEIIYHVTREEIYEAIFDKDRGLLIERKRPYREYKSATAFANSHSQSLQNGRLVCRVMRKGIEYRLKDLFDQIIGDTIDSEEEDEEEAKVESPSKSKERDMPPKKPNPVKGIGPVKHPQSIIAKWRESVNTPIELTSVYIVNVEEHEVDGSKYWFDTTNKKLYQQLPNGVGPYVGNLTSKGAIEKDM